jgi:hypothetical protein
VADGDQSQVALVYAGDGVAEADECLVGEADALQQTVASSRRMQFTLLRE